MVCPMCSHAGDAAAGWRLARCATAGAVAGQWRLHLVGFRLYSARLWTDGQGQDWARPFALELLYHRALTRDSLIQASLQEMQRLGGGGVTPQQLANWAQIMETAFTDVRPGMRIAGLYLPGAGCRFYVDGRLTAEVRDAAFARAFFAIWLGPRARDPQLRLRLLGQAVERGT